MHSKAAMPRINPPKWDDLDYIHRRATPMRWLMFAVCTMLVSTAVCAQEEVRGAVAIYDTVYERVDLGAPF
jgi:hypothetical protein